MPAKKVDFVLDWQPQYTPIALFCQPTFPTIGLRRAGVRETLSSSPSV